MFTAEQIAQWTKKGHWPPPEGETLLPVAPPNPAAVEHYLSLSPPELAEMIRAIFASPAEEQEA